MIAQTKGLTLFPPDLPRQHPPPPTSPDITSATASLVLENDDASVPFSDHVKASWENLRATKVGDHRLSLAEAWQLLRYGAIQLRQNADEAGTESFARAALRWTVLFQKIWNHSRNEKDLELLISSWDALIEFAPKAVEVRYELLTAALAFFREKYESSHSIDDFGKASGIAEKLISVASSDREHILSYGNLGRLHAIRAEDFSLHQQERLTHLEKSLENFNPAIRKRESSDTPYQKSDATLWVGTAQVLSQRYEITHRTEDIELSITHLQHSLSGETPGSELWIAWSDRLARAHWSTYRELQKLEDAREGVKIFENILKHDPQHPNASTGLAELLRQICAQEVLSNSTLRIQSSRIVELLEAIVVVTKDTDPDLPSRLGKCSSALTDRFRYDGVLQDIDIAIVLQQTALNLPQIRSNARWFHLKQLSECHILRHNRLHTGEDLEPALNAGRAAFHETSPVDKARAEAQLQFACAQATAYLHTYNDMTLENAILNLRAAEKLFTSVGWRSVSCLENLAGLLRLRFQRFGRYADAQEGIKYARESIDILRRLSGKGNNSHEARTLEILGGLMQARADEFHSEDDIDQAINALRESVKMTDAEDIHYVARAKDFSHALLMRYAMLGRAKDIREAESEIDKTIESLKLRQTKTSPRDMALLENQRGVIKLRQYHQNRSPEALDIAIKYFSRAVEAEESSLDHSYNLARACESRALEERKNTAYVAAIQCYRSYMAKIMRHAPLQVDQRKLEIFRGIAQLGLSHDASFPQEKAWMELTASRLSLLCTMQHVPARIQIWAAGEAAALAYRKDKDYAAASRYINTAVSRLAELLTLGLSRADQLRQLESNASLPSFVLCFNIRAGLSEGKALQLFEQARGVLWNRAISESNEVAGLKQIQNEALVRKFNNLRHRLALPRKPGRASDRADGMNFGEPDHYQDAEEYRTVLRDIRSIPGLEDFLSLPARTEHFGEYAREGAIVVVNSVALYGHALLITHRQTINLELAGWSTDLAKLLYEKLVQCLKLLHDRDLEAATDIFLKITNTLWLQVAKPILDKLDDVASESPGNPREGFPRVWWLTNGWMNVLPIHAAGDHQKWASTREPCTVADRAISSYIPSCSALEFARRNAQSKSSQSDGSSSVDYSALIVAMPETVNRDTLGHATKEASAVTLALKDHYAMLQIPLPPIKKTVLAGLSSCSLAHFICHGEVDAEDPTKSLLLLSDYYKSPLDIRALMRAPMTKCEFVYLSVCKTAISETMPLIDEGLHVAGAFLMAGVPYVVATWWEIVDEVAVDISKTFYEQLGIRSNFKTQSSDCHGFGLSKSAEALHASIQKMRRDEVSPLLWGAYVHFGA
jgi:hypothetical protein